MFLNVFDPFSYLVETRDGNNYGNNSDLNVG